MLTNGVTARRFVPVNVTDTASICRKSVESQMMMYTLRADLPCVTSGCVPLVFD